MSGQRSKSGTNDNIRRGGGNTGSSERKPLQEIYIGEIAHINAFNHNSNSDSDMSKKSAKASFISKRGSGRRLVQETFNKQRGNKEDKKSPTLKHK